MRSSSLLYTPCSSRSLRPFPALSPPLPRLPIPSNPALLRPPLPRDCRLPPTLPSSDLRSPKIASVALGLYPLSPLCELSHHRILTLGLTERHIFRSSSQMSTPRRAASTPWVWRIDWMNPRFLYSNREGILNRLRKNLSFHMTNEPSSLRSFSRLVYNRSESIEIGKKLSEPPFFSAVTFLYLFKMEQFNKNRENSTYQRVELNCQIFSY